MKVDYINHYLTDNDIANAARLSFNKKAENYTDEQNASLIRYLARGMQTKDWEAKIDEILEMGIDYTNNEGIVGNDEKVKKQVHDFLTYIRSVPEHWVPFGHPHVTLHVQVPVPIARQLFKHKIGFVESEESRRYVSETPTIYTPPEWRAKAENVKQGSGDRHPDSDYWAASYQLLARKSIQTYEDMIEAGIAPEMARFALIQGVEVQWIWTGSLFAVANVYNQRADSHAQKESQIVAGWIDDIMTPLFPIAWPALTKGAY